MKKFAMTKARCTKTFLIFCLLAVATFGCATRKTMPAPSFRLMNSESLIFGRLEIVVDGQLTEPFGSSFGRSAGWHFSPFTSVSAVENNLTAPGEYMLLIDREDGYFAAAIPPGDYYFVELIAAQLAPGTGSVGIRSYQGSCDPPLSAIRDAVALIFHAKSGVAIYIGTIQLRVSRNAEFMCTVLTTGGSFVRNEPRRGTVVEGWTIINDNDSAANKFHGLFPNVPTLDTRLIRIEPLTLRLKPLTK